MLSTRSIFNVTSTSNSASRRHQNATCGLQFLAHQFHARFIAPMPQRASEVGLHLAAGILLAVAVFAGVIRCALGKHSCCWKIAFYNLFGYVALISNVLLIIVLFSEMNTDFRGGNSAGNYETRTQFVLLAVIGGTFLGLGWSVWCSTAAAQGLWVSGSGVVASRAYRLRMTTTTWKTSSDSRAPIWAKLLPLAQEPKR